MHEISDKMATHINARANISLINIKAVNPQEDETFNMLYFDTDHNIYNVDALESCCSVPNETITHIVRISDLVGLLKSYPRVLWTQDTQHHLITTEVEKIDDKMTHKLVVWYKDGIMLNSLSLIPTDVIEFTIPEYDTFDEDLNPSDIELECFNELIEQNLQDLIKYKMPLESADFSVEFRKYPEFHHEDEEVPKTTKSTRAKPVTPTIEKYYTAILVLLVILHACVNVLLRW